ncbi:MAG TPA: OmcA/MtrC family decaheme c-type cytochrome [Thermoanaerobaculia bacterium]|nr:OmcA/MtrC family decaheme c-type cytochrome [Thermoanaerobaculia bacterium]
MALNPRRMFLVVMLALVAMPLVAADRKRASTPTTPGPKKYSASQKEYYLSPNDISYVRPGLTITVNSVTIGADRKPVVDLSITDNLGQPLDRLGKTTPGAISMSWILAWYNPATRQYTNYVVRTVTAVPTSPNAGKTATQASTDSGGKWVDLDTGHATYTFGTVLPSGFDQTKTHTLAIYATRAMGAVPGIDPSLAKNYYDNVEYDFRPDGQKVTDTWDKINEAASCNNCHDPLSAHGGSRQDVKLCVTCHQPQTSDPTSGNTVDFKVMIHKIHDGPNLPSVLAGNPYQIVGYQNAVSDFSGTTFPQDIRNCANCHEGTDPKNKPTQALVYLTNPSRDACGSCHDDINWTTGANHPAGAQANDLACATCHIPDSGQEWDASVKGAHLLPQDSKQLQGIKATIVSVSNFKAGQKPTVVYKLTNSDGSFIDGSKLATFSPIFAGPTSNYGPNYRDNAVNKATFDATAGTTTYTFAEALPANASGTWVVSADIRRNVTLKRADGQADIAYQESTINPIQYVAVTGTVTPRRTAVTLAQCNTCHDALSLHGGQRNTTEECVICHNPTADDSSMRGASNGAPESISLQRMVHRIHSGDTLTQDYTIYGFGNSKNTFNDVTFPGDRRDCAKCHAGTAYTLPLQPGIASVTTLRDYFSPQGPATAACLGCHDNSDAAAHAYLNTASFPGATQGAEACATCHGTGKDWDVAKVHAR